MIPFSLFLQFFLDVFSKYLYLKPFDIKQSKAQCVLVPIVYVLLQFHGNFEFQTTKNESLS